MTSDPSFASVDGCDSRSTTLRSACRDELMDRSLSRRRDAVGET